MMIITELNRDKEIEPKKERYRMVEIGGRIKSAGVSCGHLYNAASPVIENPDDVQSAFETSKRFTKLKANPPFEFRVAFFPRDEATMRMAFSGSGIHRTTIKTDQGPAGNVGYFYIDRSRHSNLQGKIIKEEGVAQPEAFLSNRFTQASLPENVQEKIAYLVADIQESYQRRNYKKAYEGILKLRQIGSNFGIETTRKAGVGREEFFFFRPVSMNKNIVIGRDLLDRISDKTQEVVEKVESLASAARYFVKAGFSLEEAKKRAYEVKDFYKNNGGTGLLYFQPDVLIRKDGSFDIERINIPDLGMFLTEVEAPSTNETFNAIKDINLGIREEVMDVVCQAVGDSAILMTRDEVLQDHEDTLEQLEIVAFSKGLKDRGKDVTITSLTDIDSLPDGSSIIMLNVDPNSGDFNKLLYRVARGEIECFPDPFLKLFEKEATTFRRIGIQGRALDKFMQKIVPSNLDKPEGVLAKYKGIQSTLKAGGIEKDIVYFHIGENGTYVPTFRYDVKSFFEVYKAVDALKKQGKDADLVAIPVPFKPEDAIIEGTDGPRLALCRFMFVKK